MCRGRPENGFLVIAVYLDFSDKDQHEDAAVSNPVTYHKHLKVFGARKAAR